MFSPKRFSAVASVTWRLRTAPGQQIQKIVEIPTVQEVVEEQEVPEVQVINKVVEVPQVRQLLRSVKPTKLWKGLRLIETY